MRHLQQNKKSTNFSSFFLTKFYFSKSNSSYLQKFSPEDDLKATSNDPVAQLQEVFQIIIHLAAERGKLKVTPNELSEEESENYEKLLRQLEAEVRNHVGVTLPNIKKLYNISKFRVDPTTVNSLR